ncbi:MAG: phosphoribosylglycinamide formyltransferase-1 [Myxococcota bacterium]|jgi:phosphoribosylglycinamide formyltransferase-1
MAERVPVGVLASGSGTNLQALLDACNAPGFPARVAVVLTNRGRAGALDRARQAGVPTEVVLRRDHPDRAAWDAEAVRRLQAHGVQWVCLAGFMRLITPTFLDAFPNRVLNIHPSLLPAFPGLDAQGQAFAARVRITGCTVHVVDAGTDTGPIVIQGAVPVRPTDDPDALKARILKVEHQIYPRALRWAADGHLTMADGAVHVSDQAIESATWVWHA